jgi:PAS domain S-box-containing protein
LEASLDGLTFWSESPAGSVLIFRCPIVMLLFEARQLESGSGAIVELGLTALLAFALVLAVALWLRRIIARSVGSAARAPIHPGEAGQRSQNGPGEVNALVGELEATIARLREREHQLRLVTDNAPVGIVHWDAELRYKFINKYHAERLKERRGLVPEQVIGKRLPEVLGDRFFTIIEPYVRECLAGKSVEFEVEVPFEGAEWQYLYLRFAPEWKDGKVVGLVSAGTNITGLKRIEIALRESEATFRAMFDESSVGKIEIVPEHGRFLRANAAFCDFVGYSEDELRGLTVWDITHPEERERDREPVRRVISGESPGFDVEKRYIRKDGTPVWAHTTVNLIRDKSGYPVRNFAVIQDINERKRAEHALRTSKERLQLALDATQLGWWQYDPRRRVISGDTRFQQIFNAPGGDIPIEDIVTKRLHSDDAQRVWEAFQAALDPADPRPYATQYRVERGAGDVRWVEAHGLAHFEDNGRERRAVSIVGTVQDITERKEREEKEHLLMREINHRAKNMLSVVESIAHQTAAQNPEDFVERFSERIQALSANQDLLVRNEWQGVDVEDLVRAQLAHFADLIGSRIVLQVAKLRLNPASAQAIGLALHELATNAGKYGALSTDRGQVNISWGIEGDAFMMSWIECEGPVVSPPERRGFGTMVMEAMAARSLDGTVDLDFPSSGATWRLTCPAAKALEPWQRRQSSGGTGNRMTSQLRSRVEAQTTA